MTKMPGGGGSQSDDGDSLSIYTNESDSLERFDATEGEPIFMFEGGMTFYCREYFYKPLTDKSINSNVEDAQERRRRSSIQNPQEKQT